MARTQTSTGQRTRQRQDNWLLRFILGESEPDAYTKITFYTVGIIAFLFLVWNIVGYVALTFQHLIHVHRHVAIDSIFAERGAKLGYSAKEFTDKLSTLFCVSIVCWLLILFSLVLLWRKSTRYFPLLMAGLVIFVGMLFFYLGYDYFRTDTSAFDKISLIVIFVMSTLHYFILKKEQSGEGLSFFDGDAE
jgi:uncharacterized membrane protein